MIETLPNEIVNGVPLTKWKGPKGAKLYLVHTRTEWDAFFELLMKEKVVACDTETSGFDWFRDDHIVGMSFGWRDQHFYIPVRHEDSDLAGKQIAQLEMDELRPQLQEFFAQEDIYTIWHFQRFDKHFYAADDIEIKTHVHDTRIMWQLYDENAPGKLKIIASGWKDAMGQQHKGLVDKTANEKEKEIDRWRDLEAKCRRKRFTGAVMAIADRLQTEPAYQGIKRAVVKKHINVEIALYLAGGTTYDQEIVDEAEVLLDNNVLRYAAASKEGVHYGLVPVDLMCEYAGMDTFMTWHIYNYVRPHIAKNDKLIDLYCNEIALSDALYDAELDGIVVDPEFLEIKGSEWDDILELKTAEIKLILGDINLGSDIQLAKALMEQGVELTQRTPSGQYQVNKKVLKKFEKQYDIISKILEMRAIQKLRTTYAAGILSKLVDGKYLHCSFNQNVATGRMSCRDPNLQNIPGRDLGLEIRRAFINPDPDEYDYLFADYSQVEVRLTAHHSQDPILLEAYARGEDVHVRTACELFDLDYDFVIDVLKNDITHPQYKLFKALRGLTKTVNFAIVYGVGATGLADQIPTRPEQYEDLDDEAWVEVCREFIHSYLDRLKGVRRLITVVHGEIRKDCEVTNSHGRVRHLPHAQAVRITKNLKFKWMQAKAERQGLNFLVQGDAADVFKKAVVRVHRLLKGKKSRICNFVHDEIQIYLHKSERYLLPLIKKAMEDFPQFTVPLLVDFEVSQTNWAEKKEIHHFPEINKYLEEAA